MNYKLKCQCGWEGDVDGALDSKLERCPDCSAPLPTASTNVEIVAPDDEVSGPVSSLDATPVPSAPPNSASDPTAGKGVAALLDRVTRGLRPAWEYVRAAGLFYVESRAALRDGWRIWINEHLPSLDRPDAIRREIRASLDEQEGIHEESGVWQIELPPRCVVCGGQANGAWIIEPRTVLDPYGPIVGPLAGLIAGFFLGWWYQNQLCLLLAIFAGVLAGYATRKEVRFRLRFRRCSKHAEPGRLPEVLVLHRHLVVRVGSRDVKLAFLQRGRDYDRTDRFPLPVDSGVLPHTEPLELANDVHPGAAIVPEQSARLAAAEDENASPAAPPAGPDEYRLSK